MQTTTRTHRARYASLRAYVDAQPRGTTIAQIAEELGVAPNTLSQYLSGYRTPSGSTALRLSKQFHISLEGLLS